jgi:hypothetical protein
MGVGRRLREQLERKTVIGIVEVSESRAKSEETVSVVSDRALVHGIILFQPGLGLGASNAHYRKSRDLAPQSSRAACIKWHEAASKPARAPRIQHYQYES